MNREVTMQRYLRDRVAWWCPLVVAAACFIQGTALAQSPEQVKQTRDEIRAKLAKDKISPWALDCVAELVMARNGLSKRADGKAIDLSKIPQEDWLASLDAEVDLLATAMLALEEPESVIAIYRNWYADAPNDGAKRTPAAPLLLAQARSLRAWHLLSPPPGKLQEAVPNREEMFKQANVELAKAWTELYGHTQELVGEPKRETLAMWIQKGPPKAKSLADLDKIDDCRDPSSLPAFQGVDYARSYLFHEARILRLLGDQTFRETGSSIGSAKTSQSTALGYYSQARLPLYLARLIDVDDREGRYEAKLLSDRISWIRQGQCFGGIDFFQFDRHVRDSYIPASMAELDKRILELKELRSADAARVASQASWIGNLQQQGATRKLLGDAFKADARRQLQAHVIELSIELNKIQRGASIEELERLERDLGQFVQEFGNELQSVKYQGELERFRFQLLAEMLHLIQEIERLGGLTDRAKSEDFKAIAVFIESLPNSSSIEPELRAAWKRAESGEASARTTIHILAAEVKAADLEKQRFDLDLEAYDVRKELAGLEDELKSLQSKVEEKDAELENALKKFREGQEFDLDVSKVKRMRERIVPQLQKDVERLAGRAKDAVAQVKKVQEELQKAKKVIQDIREAKKRVEDAFDTITGVIEAAKKIPKVHAAGVASGTTVDVGDAIASTAQSVLDKIVAIYEGKIDAQELDAAIQSAEDRVKGYLDTATKLEDQLREKKDKLDDEKAAAEERARYQPGGDIYKAFEARKATIEDAKKEIEKRISMRSERRDQIVIWIQGVERRQLENRAQQAAIVRDQAVARLDRALLERNQRIAALRAHSERLGQQRREASAARDLIENYRARLSEKKQKFKQKEADVAAEVDQADKALMEQIKLRLKSLQAELAALDQPSKRTVAADLIESLTPALAIASTRTDPADVWEKKLAANSALANAARWLYVLGDEGALPLASPCQSLREFELAQRELQNRWLLMKRRYTETRHKVFVMSLNRKELAETFKDGRLLIRTVANWPASGEASAPVAAAKESPYYLADRIVWQYKQPEISEQVATFFLTRSAAETDGAGVLAGGWVVCRWEDSKKNIVESPGPFFIPAFYRQGAMRVRWRGITRTMQMKADRNFGVEALVLDDFSRAGNFQRFIADLPPTNDHYLEQPAVGQNHGHFFGVGLDNRWVFELRDRQGTKVGSEDKLVDNATLAAKGLKLVELDIVLTYLFPTEQQTPADSLEPRSPDLRFLKGNQRVVAGVEMPGAKEVDSAALKSEVQQQLHKILGQGAPPAVPAPVGKDKTPIADAILEPIPVQARLLAAEKLLGLLSESIKRDYYTPLRVVDNRLKALGYTVESWERAEGRLTNEDERARQRKNNVELPIYKIDLLVRALRDVNAEYGRVDRQVDEMQEIVKLLRGNQLDTEQLKELNEALATPVPREFWLGKLAEKVKARADQNPEEQRAAIAFVLEKLVEWAKNINQE